MCEEVIEDVSIENPFPSEFFAKFIAFDRFRLALRVGEIEQQLFGVPLEGTTILMLLYFPSFRNERPSIAVDHEFDALITFLHIISPFRFGARGSHHVVGKEQCQGALLQRIE